MSKVPPPATSEPEARFALAWRAHNGPAFEREHRFCDRAWRFDFAWPSKMIAVEIEGGVWTRGRHTRGSGFIADCEKYNEAARLGWRVFRLAPEMIQPAALESILEVLR